MGDIPASNIDMSVDPKHPPTDFNHKQWLDLRNFLWKNGRPFQKSKTDQRKHIYDFARYMSHVQENYVHDPPKCTGYLTTIGNHARLCVESAAIFLKPANLTWTKNGAGHATLATKIPDLNNWYAADPLARTITNPNRAHANGVMAALNWYGNRASHVEMADIRPDEKSKIVGLIFRLGEVIKNVFERKYLSGGPMNLKNLSIPELQALILAAQNELKRRLATAKQNNAGNFGKVLQTWGDDPSTYASTANQTVQQLTTLSSEMNGLNGDLSAAKAEEAKEKTNGNFQAAKKAQTEVRRLKGELDKKKADREELGKSRITDVEHAIHAILIQQAELEQKIKRALDKGDYDAADQHQKNKIHLKDAMAKIKKIHAHLVNVLQKVFACNKPLSLHI